MITDDFQKMKSPIQIRRELLDALAQLASSRPEWRFGQTIANLATTTGHMDAAAVWDLEDEKALEAARILIAQSEADAGRREDFERYLAAIPDVPPAENDRLD